METILAKHPDKVKAIGVSNFSIAHLEALRQASVVTPAVNQIELHPSLQQDALVQYCRDHGIQVVAYSPLGSPQSSLMSDEQLFALAERNNATVAQCLISWGVRRGWGVMPKSVSNSSSHYIQ